jgi:hypothetical protein
MVNEQLSPDAAAERSRRNLRTAVILGLIAAAFYFGFIATFLGER